MRDANVMLNLCRQDTVIYLHFKILLAPSFIGKGKHWGRVGKGLQSRYSGRGDCLQLEK